MNHEETIAWVVVLLLALYGCAQVIRRLCLWLTRCPGCAVCCRVAVPRKGAALAPLVRCLESQAVWGDGGCPYGEGRHTLLVLPPLSEEERLQLPVLRREAPSVIPVTADQVYAILQQLAAEEPEEK